MTKRENVAIHLAGHASPVSFSVDESELSTLLQVAEQQAGCVALPSPQGLAYIYGRHIQRIIRPEFRNERTLESVGEAEGSIVTDSAL
ncbi:hypothetical protein LAJ19_21445 (plasmid) [Deinococcus taeanensis]|uniref:hypothetical protein n=1 Tax=Deinococcus taeanensis TaxID=2737050 RepID=UPI001CDD86B3|nr:hypothetical protein [Deinococcus taeanensis]UBV45550.1 hypothetical protein LAJ19_21445 [Deinococcus taeanensis]